MADEVEIKTAKPASNSPSTNYPPDDSNPGVNVLHNYRSYNTIFTLALLNTDEVNNPDTYRKGSSLNYVILKSGGKGTDAIKLTNAMKVGAAAPQRGQAGGDDFAKRDPRRLDLTDAQKNAPAPDYGSQFLSEFNEKSPGRFDMFIDNVQIDTLMARDKNSASTQPTNITFDVFEPYSINGFIEALQVASQAAGYPTYKNAVFVLKMEFIGYPDGDDMPAPEQVPQSVRYFTLRITNLEVSVDEKGTRYVVSAVPSNEIAFGNPSELKKSIKVTGRTVKDILTNLVDSLSAQIKKEDEDSKERPVDHDEYKVKFPSWDDQKGWVDTDNLIASAKVTEITEDSNLFKMPDPGEATKSSTKYGVSSKQKTESADGKRMVSIEPGDPVVQFNENRSVQECMEAIIRDSHYLREKLEKLMGAEWKSVVKDNMFDYFLIKLEVTEKKEIDKRKNRHFCIYTYVVTPYKMLFTKVPGFSNQTVDQSLLFKSCVRRYDYIYTGNNLDITSFKLNFNNLYFEAIPAGMGNPAAPPARDTVSKTDGTEYKTKDGNTQETEKGNAGATVQSSADLTTQYNRSGGQPQRTPYYAMAQSLHEAIVNSKSSMINGDIEILGDPMYLVTGGVGNYSPKPSEKSPRVTDQGEAAFNYGDVLININFRNPIDIGEDGLMIFDDKLIPFSGVYQVLRCKSNFKDGGFKQSLEIMRMPGQALPTKNPALTPQSQKTPQTDPSAQGVEVPNPDEQTTDDTSPVTASQAGIRPDMFSLSAQLNRSLPNPGLPGQANNFTAATGGLGGTVSVTPVSGVMPNLPGVAKSISPLGVQTQPAFDMPLPARAAVGLQQRVYSPGGYLQQLGDNLMNTFGIQGAPRQLVNQVLHQYGNKINSIPVLGSGIGIGATMQIVKNNPTPQTTADYQNQQLPEQPTATPSVAGVSGNALGYLANNLTAVPGISNNSALMVQSALQGGKTDPAALAVAFGVNQAQISGLSPNLSSNLINQLDSMTKKVPADTDLNTAVNNGVNVNGLTPSEVSSLPPTAPFAAAPPPAQDTGFLNKIASSTGLSGLARSFGVNSIDQVSQSQLPADAAQTAESNSPSVVKNYMDKLGLSNLKPQDAAVLGLKLYAERKSLMGPTGIPGSLEGNFIGVRNQLGPVNVVGNLGNSAPSVFGSKTVGSSPLDKIMIR